ncbi:hypothetical protein LTS14_006083 [Recurvomyces mirabilis]|uniref:uncharacterized protein n=1 Tax=Recurvomyces mirabilis TaxID=574656 RepID=UPI002DE19A2D|nr:hypothetical protein LTS14_006083 [Recurvomyces mirabilis]
MLARLNESRRKSSSTAPRRDSGIAGLPSDNLERVRTVESIPELPLASPSDEVVNEILQATSGDNQEPTRVSYAIFRLPAELRILIYELIWADLPSESTIDLFSTAPPSAALLLTTKRLHYDAKAVFRGACQQYWSLNTFRLTIDYKTSFSRIPAARFMHGPIRQCSRDFVQQVEVSARKGWESISRLEAVQLRPQATVTTRRVSQSGLWKRETEIWINHALETSNSTIRLRCSGPEFSDIALQMVSSGDAVGRDDLLSPFPSVKHQLMFLAGW